MYRIEKNRTDYARYVRCEELAARGYVAKEADEPCIKPDTSVNEQ